MIVGPRHPKSGSVNKTSIYPTIICEDGCRPRIRFKFKTGYVRGYSGFRNLSLNVDGRLMKWQGQLVNFPINEGQRYIANIDCDEEWLQHLDAMSRSKVAVWRMEFEVRNTSTYITKPAVRDFEVQSWNKVLVAEMLTAYSAILTSPKKEPVESESSVPGPSSAQELDSREQPMPSSHGVPPVQWGPFMLMPDGSISEPNAGLEFPPGVSIGEMKFRGYTFRSHPSGAYLLTNPHGAIGAVQFH